MEREVKKEIWKRTKKRRRKLWRSQRQGNSPESCTSQDSDTSVEDSTKVLDDNVKSSEYNVGCSNDGSIVDKLDRGEITAIDNDILVATGRNWHRHA
ncbi:hypothetical protein PoB_002311500 [Plakobranchus ocellatus]|uniref:Uncharacterized protein n=1 Tax=Plakobranchus ocellatus TaxID=259542 RepID=A0AAV3ZPT4_9GAST|nr:hypothetical protein PoB_002311500 [Plakobranchus ocellatus]